MNRPTREKNGYHHATSYWALERHLPSPSRNKLLHLHHLHHLHLLSKGCISQVVLFDVVCSLFVIFCSCHKRMS